MNQIRKDLNDLDPDKPVDEKDSLMHIKKTKSILDRSFESDEEIAVTVDETALTATVTSMSSGPKTLEVFTSLAYCSDNQTLCAGTNQGNLYIWKRNTSPTTTTLANGYENGINGFESMENFWHLVNIVTVRGAIKHCSWGVCDVATPCVLVNCISNVYILKVKNKFHFFSILFFYLNLILMFYLVNRSNRY